MEAGGFADASHNEAALNLLEYFKTKYYEKPSLNEFFTIQKPSSYSFDVLAEKVKLNFDRFAIYYFGIAMSFYLIFFLTNTAFLIPIFTIATTLYLVNTKHCINTVEITPLHAVGGCIAINLILCIVWPSFFLQKFIYFFAINAFVICIIVVHSQFVIEKDEEKL
ncbi:hypothetical protein NUSPORA_00276 [Nucleospora cyclopteri]